MTGPFFVDTNVFVYSRVTTVAEKHARANEWLAHLWRSGDGRVSAQVLNEYYSVLTRKLKPRMTGEEAQTEVRDLFAWQPLPLDADVVESAWAIEGRYGLAWWDSLVVAAAQVGGCRYLLTEDLQHGQDLDGVTVLNPFLRAPTAAE